MYEASYQVNELTEKQHKNKSKNKLKFTLALNQQGDSIIGLSKPPSFIAPPDTFCARVFPLVSSDSTFVCASVFPESLLAQYSRS